MGLAPYRVTSGEIWFKGQRIDALPVDKRAQMGLGMSFQRPPALEGVTVEAFTAAIGSRSEEHTSELQSLMRISYAVFCVKKKNTTITYHIHHNINKTTKLYLQLQ